jgi:hypothetical protein
MSKKSLQLLLLIVIVAVLVTLIDWLFNHHSL